MKLLDTNVCLRYLIRDNEEMYTATRNLIQTEHCVVFPEVIAEVVYVLLSFYNIPRADISRGVVGLFDDVECTRLDAVTDALDLFSSTRFDFVDCLLIAYHRQYGWDVATFDKKMRRYL